MLDALSPKPDTKRSRSATPQLPAKRHMSVFVPLSPTPPPTFENWSADLESPFPASDPPMDYVSPDWLQAKPSGTLDVAPGELMHFAELDEPSVSGEAAVLTAFGVTTEALTNVHLVNFLESEGIDIARAIDEKTAGMSLEVYLNPSKFRATRVVEDFFIFKAELEARKLPAPVIERLIGPGPRTVSPALMGRITTSNRVRWTSPMIVNKLIEMNERLDEPRNALHAKEIHERFKAGLRKSHSSGRAIYTDDHERLTLALAREGLDWQEIVQFIGGTRNTIVHRTKTARKAEAASQTEEPPPPRRLTREAGPSTRPPIPPGPPGS